MTRPPSHRTVVVLQPGYLPWLGFFDQMRRADVFVYYDDVQFDKHGWRNRNRIKSASGIMWLTVPVRHGGLGPQRIIDVEIDGDGWARKHVASIRQYYARAPFTRRYLPELEAVLRESWRRIVDLDLAVASLLAAWLGVSTTIVRSSSLGIAGDRSQRLVNICRHFAATRYLSGDAARDYLDLDLFGRNGISVEWQQFRHPVYPQQHGEFVPYLSALDLILNCGEDSARVLSSESPT